MTMKQGSGTAGTREERQFPVRWIALFTGSKATEDYQPFSSTGEDPALVREVTDMCLTFHPHSDIRLFPNDRDTFLFWKANATGEWVITRISLAPNPEGVRTALEYCSLVFSMEELALLRFNPFRVRDLNLHDLARDQFQNKNFEPVSFEMPQERSAVKGGASGNASGRPNISQDNISSAENVRVLEEFCASHHDGPPPTFATWWANGGKPPAPGYFDIVLRSIPPRVMTLREAADGAAVLSGQVKAALPTPRAGDTVVVEMSKTLMAGADTVLSGVTSAASGLNTSETVEQFQGHLADAARVAGQMSSDLQVLRRRLETTLSAGENARLADIAGRYDELARELTKVRHPNPFAARSNAGSKAAASAAVFSGGTPAIAAQSNGSAAGKSGSSGRAGAYNPAFIVAPIVIGVIALTAWKFSAGSGNEAKNTAVRPSPAATAVVRQTPKPAASAAPSASQVALSLLQKEQDSVADSAKRKAEADARSAALSRGELNETVIQKITLDAIESSYKQKLSSSDFNKAFVATKDWDYARYRQALTSLVPTVHESAVVGATEGKAERRIKAAEAATKNASDGDAEKEKARLAAARAQEERDRRAEENRREEQNRERNRVAEREREREREQEREKEREREKRERERERARLAAAAREKERQKRAEVKPKPKPKPASGGGAGSADTTGL